MAAPLIPALLEAAGAAIASACAALTSSSALTAVASGAVTGAVLSLPGDTAKDQDKEKADAGATMRTQSRNCSCPPDGGQLVTRNWNMSDVSRQYQARVTGFASMTEWSFEGNDFDGFRSGLCQLEEAKARYDQFFDEDGQPEHFWGLSGEPGMINQASRQNIVVAASPPSKLVWYFMKPVSYRYFTRQFAISAPLVRTIFQP